jgi:hypothetical protein
MLVPLFAAGCGDPGGAGDSGGVGPGATSGTNPGGSVNGGEDAGGEVGPGPIVTASKALVSGTRLKVRVYEGSDGSKMPMVGSLTSYLFRDTQLNVDCTIERMSDGIRCMPKRAELIAEQRSDYIYKDATCKTPLFQPQRGTYCGVLVDDGITFIDVRDRASGDACAETHRYYRIAATYTGTLYQYSPGGWGAPETCKALSSNPGTYVDYGEEVPLESFVKLTEGLL